MLNPNHPDDERLSALASRDDDAAADTSLSDHVAACERCTAMVADLSVLRTTLADLPDIQPSRPLRFLPPVGEAPAAAGAVGWVRRLFAPAMTAGAALALVGVVGMAAPLMAGGQAAGGADADQREAAVESEGPAAGELDGVGSLAPLATGGEAGNGDMGVNAATDDADTEHFAARDLPAERSPWPMVLFTGVALMIGAVLLRWVLVPRAG